MGVGLFPLYDPPVAGAQLDSDGKLLAAELYTLDGLCDELGVAKISSFTDNREPPADFLFDPEGDLEELDEMLGSWEEWFQPENALPAVGALIQAISSQEAVAARMRHAARLLDELRALEASLRTAAAAGARFRFDIF